jgi:hypothetical protein
MPVIEYAHSFKNRYLFQTKNPARFEEFVKLMDPAQYVLCTTIETNYYFKEMGEAPDPEQRSNAMARLPKEYRKMITVEPIMRFDLKNLSCLILACNPAQVNIGADTGNNNLLEPEPKEIQALIKHLSRYTKVFPKENLKRLLKEKIT